MKPSNHILLATIAALSVAVAGSLTSNDASAADPTGNVANRPSTAGGAKNDRRREEIHLESWSFGGNQPGKTGGANQLQMNDTKGSAPQQTPGAPLPSESMSLNFGKIKPAAPAVPNQLGQEQKPQEGGMLLPAVQKARDAASKADKSEGTEMKKK